ncbi:heme lyase CcmF/NrfE family subunit [Vibrio profundi]|uniref:heme lyase CcmF/NrfE family subunit n=1 Tax=Vibrio profundi TaxID=1774960 RepID=UPI003735ECF1
MIGNLGLFSLILIAAASFSVSILTGIKIVARDALNLGLIRGLTLISTACSILAICLLGFAFAVDDFSLAYVSSHSNSQLPTFFKIAAVWAGHEGSLLFWVLTLSGWAGIIALQSKYQADYAGKVLWVMNLLICTFTVFTLAASNPFELNLTLPAEGRDLNPMLQDVGLIFHPPLLYLGYVGFSAVLAFAIAALMTNEIELQWSVYCKNWCIVAWGFLTAGIILGSWWAYYELGWGGWWFWDPVENASLLPWLTSTALLHCIVASNQKHQLLKWSLSLAIVTFCLSILGTFIVRSGVLTSVHAFAVDPSKGIALLVILLTVLLCSLSLLIVKSERFSSEPITKFWSKSFAILLAASLFVIATLIVLLGTFYPMMFELLGLGNISVGAPYFNSLFAPLTLITLVTMGLTPFILISRTATKVQGRLSIVAILSFCVGIGLYWIQSPYLDSFVLVTWIISTWVITSHLMLVMNSYNTSLFKKSFSMSCAHIGIAIVAIGAAMNSEQSFEKNQKLQPGESVQFVDWKIHYEETDLVVGPNYTAERARLVLSDGKTAFEIVPERRHYQVRVMNMSEPAMKWFWHGDVYITLGEKIDDSAYALRIQYKAYVRWVWFGGILSILGGVLALLPSVQTRRETARWKDAKQY